MFTISTPIHIPDHANNTCIALKYNPSKMVKLNIYCGPVSDFIKQIT